MNEMNRYGLLIPVALVALSTGLPNVAGAHEAKCPFCEMDVVLNTPQLDNEVALKYGKKRIEYRCVMCAIADAKTYEGNITILAPTEIKGKPALIHRENGSWRSEPHNLVFIGERVKHRHCQIGYRAFTSQSAMEAHVKNNKVILKEGKALTLSEMVKLSESYAKE